jgi:hypothetical protein
MSLKLGLIRTDRALTGRAVLAQLDDLVDKEKRGAMRDRFQNFIHTPTVKGETAEMHA